jgi:hypothetical protein
LVGLAAASTISGDERLARAERLANGQVRKRKQPIIIPLVVVNLSVLLPHLHGPKPHGLFPLAVPV